MASCSPAVLIAQAAGFQHLSVADLARIKTQALCDRANKPVPPTAPVLTSDGTIGFNWVWTGTDPDHWNIEESDDGSTGWASVDTPLGSDRSDGGIAFNGFWRISGEDAGNVRITGYSNIVQVTGM